MKTNPLAYSVPFFALMLLVEWAVARRRAPETYNFEDTVSNLSTGVLLLIVDSLARGFTFGCYVYVYERVRIATFSDSSVWTWILFFFGTDLCYYVFHRLAHTTKPFWLVHAPHHQSEHYNFSVALRQGAFQYTVDSFFYLPLAVLGCPPWVFLVQLGILKLYQFWLHTQLIGRLPLLEGIFSTPSSHRVHHARNEPYLNKNMGGTLALWDRLFGTWQPEREDVPLVFGVDPPIGRFNPLAANFSELTRWARPARPGAFGAEPARSSPAMRAYLAANLALCALLVVLAMRGVFGAGGARNAALGFAACGIVTAVGLLDAPLRFIWLDLGRWLIGGAVLTALLLA